MLEKIAHWCRQFSPLVGLEDAEMPGSLLLDVTGLGPFFGGEAALAETIVQRFNRRGLKVRVAVADTLGAAWAVAHFGRWPAADGERYEKKADAATHSACHPPPSALVVPPGETFPVLRPLPIEALRLSNKTVDQLHQLGVYQVGQLAWLPRRELNPRFGPELLRRWDQALGRVAEPVPAQPIPADFYVEESLDYPTGRRKTITMIFQQLIGQLAGMLFQGGRGAMRLLCRLDCEGTRAETFSVSLFQPAVSSQHLFQLVEMQLERLSLRAPVTAVSVRATITAPLERRQQELFVDDREARRPGYLAALIDRLSGRLGRCAVVRPRLAAEAQPELAYRYDPLVEDRAGKRRRRRFSLVMPTELPPRPLRLVRRPVSMAAVSIQPDGPPLSFHFRGRVHRIAETEGPERIQTGWWRGRAIGRDYYRIETTTGRRFWLFRRLRDGQWFLHGMFE